MSAGFFLFCHVEMPKDLMQSKSRRWPSLADSIFSIDESTLSPKKTDQNPSLTESKHLIHHKSSSGYQKLNYH